MGSVVLAGLHQPGTVVELFQLPHAGVLRAQGGESVDRKLVSDEGTVTFNNVLDTAIFIAVGTDVYGNPSEVRTNGLPDSGPVQTPVLPNLSSSVGTGETAQSAPTPAIPEALRPPDPVVAPEPVSAPIPSLPEPVEAGVTAAPAPEVVAQSAEVPASADSPPAVETEIPAAAPVAEPPAEQDQPTTQE